MMSYQVGIEPQTHHNNFDLARIIAAVLVVVGHSEALIGHQTTRIFAIPISTYGVMIFFAIGGWLVTDSWNRSRSFTEYIGSRIARIYPGLIANVVLTMLFIGPFATKLGLLEYFGSIKTYLFAMNVIPYPVYYLPGVFSSNIYPNAVNGSLWTLPVEIFCYILLSIVGYAKAMAAGILAALGLLFAVLDVALHGGWMEIPPIWNTDVPAASQLAACFFVSASYRYFQLGIDGRTAAAVSVLWLILMITFPIGADVLRPVVLSYAILWLCLRTWHVPVRKMLGDPSYGIYLWAFPTQQLLSSTFGSYWSAGLVSVVCLLIVMPVGVLSYRWIEAPCLAWWKSLREKI